jgi:hypothetical protein
LDSITYHHSICYSCRNSEPNRNADKFRNPLSNTVVHRNTHTNSNKYALAYRESL